MSDCYREENVLSYNEVFEKIKESGLLKTNDNVDNYLELIFIHNMMMFDKKQGVNQLDKIIPGVNGKDFFNNFIKERNDVSNSKYINNKSCYYVSRDYVSKEDHLFLTMSGPNIEDSLKVAINGNSAIQSNSVNNEEVGNPNVNGRVNSFKTPLEIYKSTGVDDEAIENAFNQLFAVPEFDKKAELKSFIMGGSLPVSGGNKSRDQGGRGWLGLGQSGKAKTERCDSKDDKGLKCNMSSQVILYTLQKLLPSCFVTLLSNNNIKHIHTYGWDYGGSASIAAALILEEFVKLLDRTVSIYCRPMSPKPFITRRVFGDSMRNLLSIDTKLKNKDNFIWIDCEGDMQTNGDATTSQFLADNKIVLLANKYKRGLGISGPQWLAHGHFTYTLSQKNQSSSIKSILASSPGFQADDYLLTVNPLIAKICKIVGNNTNTRPSNTNTRPSNTNTRPSNTNAAPGSTTNSNMVNKGWGRGDGGSKTKNVLNLHLQKIESLDKIKITTLRNMAKQYYINGGSKMNKEELYKKVKKINLLITS